MSDLSPPPNVGKVITVIWIKSSSFNLTTLENWDIKRSTAMNFEELPTDVRLYGILYNLDPKSLLRYCRVNIGAQKVCYDTKFWNYYLKDLSHDNWEKLLLHIAYKGNSKMFNLVLRIGEELGQISDLVDLEMCYMYFSEHEEGKPRQAVTLYQNILSRDIDLKLFPGAWDKLIEVKKVLIPMIETWNEAKNKYAQYVQILELYFELSLYFTQEYLADFIVNNIKKLNYAKFLAVDLTNFENLEFVEQYLYNDNFDIVMMRNDIIRSLLRLNKIDILRSSIPGIIENQECENDIKSVYVAIAAFATKDEYFDLGGKITYFDKDKVTAPLDMELFKLMVKHNPEFIALGFRAMDPNEWITFSTELNKPELDMAKIYKRAIGHAYMRGYTYWAHTVENSSAYNN